MTVLYAHRGPYKAFRNANLSKTHTGNKVAIKLHAITYHMEFWGRNNPTLSIISASLPPLSIHDLVYSLVYHQTSFHSKGRV